MNGSVTTPLQAKQLSVPKQRGLFRISLRQFQL
jgi:hypothetical protein